MNKTVFLIFIILYNLQAFAQVPGYQGKRLSFEYNNYFFPSLANPTAKGNYNHNDESRKKLFSFNSRNRLSLDFVINRRNSFGLGYEFIRSRYMFNYEVEYRFFNPDVNKYYTDYQFFHIPIDIITARSLNFHYTFFSKSSLAPLGNYLQIDIGVTEYRLNYNEDLAIEKIEKYYGYSGWEQIYIKDRNPYHTGYIGLSFGKKRIFFDRLIVNRGVQFAFVPRSNRMNDIFNVNPIVPITQNNYLEMLGKSRIFNFMLVNINLGLGFLIF